MKSGGGGSTKSITYSSWVHHLFPDHQPAQTVAQLSPHHTNRGFKAGSLFDPDVQQRVLVRHWRSTSATELEGSVYPTAHQNSFGNRHTQINMGMTSAADDDPQRNCHMCYSENERDRDPPPPHYHHHHYVGSLAKDMVVKDQPHETSTCTQEEEEEEEEEEEKEVETKASATPSSLYITMVEDTQAQELIKEITTVELEVAKLEKHLLLLYRNTFLRNSFDPPNNYMHTREDRTSTASSKTAWQLCVPPAPSSQHEYNRTSLALGRKQETPIYGGQPNDPCIDSNSSSNTNAPFWNSFDSQADVPSSPCYSSENSCNLCSSHSQPLSSSINPGNDAWFPDGGSKGTIPFFNTTKGKSYSDAYSKCLKINKPNIANSDKKTIFLAQRANKLSEDLVQCMVAIYCRLAETPPPSMLHSDHRHHDSTTSHCSSPTASASDCAASNIFSTQSFPSGHVEANLQRIKADGTNCNDRSSSDSPKFVYECNVDASDSASSTFEVRCIRFDSERLSFVAKMLCTLRSLVQQLEEVDPGLMTHEQKLAFWINIHNALIMHAFLAFGIPHNRSRGILTSSSSLHHQRAAYKIGKQSIDAQTIQQRILKCKPRRRHHRTVEWLQSFDLLSPKRRRSSRRGWSWSGEAAKKCSFAIKRPEPLLYFALCCGGRSDPSVRIYREHSIYQDLEMAKQDFLHAQVGGSGSGGIQQQPDGRFMLPAILESFAKETCMKPAQLLEWILGNLDPETARSIPLHSLRGDPRADRRIAWSQDDSTFCYVFLASLCK